MSEARTEVLARIREALADGGPDRTRREAVTARLARTQPNLVPARGQRDLEGRIALFIEQAQAVMAEVERLALLSEVPGSIARYLRRHNLPQKIVLAPEPLLESARFDSQPLLRIRHGTALDEDQTGVTMAVSAAAETGTLVLASDAERPALLAFLPETSIVVLPSAWIEPAYEQAFDRVREMPGGIPRSVNLVTGPSRTADIAQVLELGAHGPRRLLILLVDDLDG